MTSQTDTSRFTLPATMPVDSESQNHQSLKAQNHAVIVLASGLSQRLGQSKQLLSKHSEPLICYMTNLALATQPKAVIIVIPKGNPAIAEVISELVIQHSTIDIVVNPLPETGMAHSLYLGIAALANVDPSVKKAPNTVPINRVLIMGVDQILLDSNHLTELLAGKCTVVASDYQHLNEQLSDEKRANEARLDEIIYDHQSKKNIIGLPIVISYKLLKQWQSTLIGDKGLRHLIRALPPNQVSNVSNHHLSYDIDTPAHLAYAQRQRWLDH